MDSLKVYSKFLFCAYLLCLTIQGSNSDVLVFQCKKNAPDADLPSTPKAYTSNIRLNYGQNAKSVEIRKVYDSDGNRAAFEIWAGKRHTKYITVGDVLLLINYVEDEHPKCKVSKKPEDGKIFVEGDAGPSDILHKISSVMAKKKGFKLLGEVIIDAISGYQYEACFDDPNVKMRLTFANPDLDPSHRMKSKNVWEPVKLEALLDNSVEVIGEFFSFQTTIPDYAEFQPPEDVYCEGYRSDVKPPALPLYFTYQSELVVYESSEGLAPIVSHRTVYYDYPTRITRIDFQDALADNRDMFSPVTAQLKSIIHDFNSGVQYSIDPISGGCKVDQFEATFTAISAEETIKNVMLNTSQFFSIGNGKLSYNGKYSTRGLTADVFSGVVENSRGKRIFHWYFSTDMTQLVENEHVEKKVLIRMLSRPETSDGKEDQVEINFYNFIKEEPSAFVYDITSCYNDSQSKAMVFTFPDDKRLRGLDTMLKRSIQDVIVEVTKVSRQRVYVREVSFNEPYIYAEFKLLGLPPVVGKSDAPAPKEPTLAEAETNLRKSVDSGEFQVTIELKKTEIVLKPEPNGLNELSGDRNLNKNDGYKQSSVVGLTIGMLLLGALLGAVLINLIISKKFGVSLFQKSDHGRNSFDNPLNESSM